MDTFYKFVHYYLVKCNQKYEDCLVNPFDYWSGNVEKPFIIYGSNKNLEYKYINKDNYHAVGNTEYTLDSSFNFFEFKQDIYAPKLDLSEYPLIHHSNLTPFGIYSIFQGTDYGNILIAENIEKIKLGE